MLFLLAYFLYCVLASIPDTSNESYWLSADLANDIETALEGVGFSVTRAAVRWLKLDYCKYSEAGCHYDNRASPYAWIHLPPGPGHPDWSEEDEKIPSSFNSLKKYPYAWRMEDNEVILVFGLTPPRFKFWSWQHYIMDHWNAFHKGWDHPAGSIGKSVNIQDVKTNGTSQFNSPFALSLSASNHAVSIVQKVLSKFFINGYENLLKVPERLFPPEKESLWRTSHLNLGVDVHSDLLSLIMRFAFPLDERADKFLTMEPLPFYVFRLTPKETSPLKISASKPTYYGPPNVTLVRTGKTEFYLGKGMDYMMATAKRQLEAQGYGCYQSITTFTRSEAFLPEWGGICMMGIGGIPYWPLVSSMNCQVDTRDTTYLMPLPAAFMLPEDLLLVAGVNHEVTKFTTYSNVNIYNFKTKTSVVQMDDKLFQGSAARFLANSPYANISNFYYAVKFFLGDSERLCNDDHYCVIIPDTEEHFLQAKRPYPVIAIERGYLNEETNMSPDDRDLIHPAFLHCRANMTGEQLWQNVTKSMIYPPILFFLKRFTRWVVGLEFISAYGWAVSYLVVGGTIVFLFSLSCYGLCRCICGRSRSKLPKQKEKRT